MTMHTILAIDAGGTSTRAVILDTAGTCLGLGHAGGGNPISAGFDGALASLAMATRQAMSFSGVDSFSSALIAMAGATSRMPREELSARFASLGLRGGLTVESDLLAVFRSGTLAPRGYALVAGTGSVAARIEDGELAAVSGGAGWLLGDGGSGFWIGHRVVRAVVAQLDGRGPETALTALLLAALELTPTAERAHGRSRVLLDLIDALYALPPVRLSRFAPLAFQAQGDPVARAILEDAAAELVATLAAIRLDDADGPVVLGGSILGDIAASAGPGSAGALSPSPVASALAAALGGTRLIPVRDGIVGAAVLGLTRAGVPVDSGVRDRIRNSVAELRATPLGMGTRA